MSDDENEPINKEAMTEDQQRFFGNYETLCMLLPYEADSIEYRAIQDALAAMLLQANKWGQKKAADCLREWASEFGDNSVQTTIRAVVNEGADRIEGEI